MRKKETEILAADDSSQELFDLVKPKPVSGRPIDGVSIGKLSGFDTSGAPLVDFPENTTGAPVSARTTIDLEANDVGREIALLFERGDARRPILLGCLQTRPALEIEPQATAATPQALSVVLDGKRLVFHAEEEIVLHCGKASITLTKAGKVLIRGDYLLSRSSGVNRIKGGSVQIN